MKFQNFSMFTCLLYYSCIIFQCAFNRISTATNHQNPSTPLFSCTLTDYTPERSTPLKIEPDLEQKNTLHHMLSIATQFTATTDLDYTLNTIKDRNSLFTDTFNHYGDKYYPQWQLSYFKSTDAEDDSKGILSVFFKGTDTRLNDITINLLVAHVNIPLINGKHINVHEGVFQGITSDIFLSHLENDLQYLNDKYMAEYKFNPLQNIKLLIQGHSLGGGYATFFLLLMFDTDINKLEVDGIVKDRINIIRQLLGIPLPKMPVPLMNRRLAADTSITITVDVDTGKGIDNFDSSELQLEYLVLLLRDVEMGDLTVPSNVQERINERIREIQELLSRVSAESENEPTRTSAVVDKPMDTDTVVHPPMNTITADNYELELKNVFMITLGSIMIVFHEDCKGKLSRDVVDRMWFLMNAMDPVPMILGGRNGMHVDAKKKHDFLFKGVVAKALEFASNGAIHGAHYFVLSGDGESFMMNDDAIEIHLNKGAECIMNEKINVGLAFIKSHLTSVYSKRLKKIRDYSGKTLERPDHINRHNIDVDSPIVYGQSVKPQSSFSFGNGWEF